MRVWSPFALSALAACVAACGSSSNNPFDDEDGGADAGVIARGDASSLGSDAAGTPGLDSATIPGIDAASSPGTDASPTPGTDAAPGPDSAAGMDAATVAMDAAPGVDAAPMGMDAAPGPDSGAGMDSAVMGMDATNGMEGGLKDAAGMEASPPDAAASDAGKTPGTAAANAVIVNPGTVHQSISGFGASTAWMGSAMTAAQADTAFSTTAGAGLSLDRVRINYQGNGTSAPETATALLAQARGARVWATPWTPPIADKSNDNDVEGTLTNPTAFASFLSTYVGAMKTAGVNLYAVSSQNEPDANVTYESCVYTGATLATFVGTSMAPALKASGVKIMTPETQNWDGFQTFEPALAANATAWAATNIVATHEYGGNPAAYPAIQAAGKEFWETEWYASGSPDATMTNGLIIANEIYQALTVASMSAWHYWWFFPTDGSGNEGLWDYASNAPAKRLWVLGNFSRFVRPGFNRIDVAGTKPPNGVSVIAFQNPADDTVAVVAINTGGATSVPLFVAGASWPSSVVPWTTSSADNLTSGTAITVSGGNFTGSLAAESVTTFVGSP